MHFLGERLVKVVFLFLKTLDLFMHVYLILLTYVHNCVQMYTFAHIHRRTLSNFLLSYSFEAGSLLELGIILLKLEVGRFQLSFLSSSCPTFFRTRVTEN